MPFQPAAVIARKRDGYALTSVEIADLVDGYCRGVVPDYQMAAWAMAVYLRGMTPDETAALTDQMLRSGTVLNWPDSAPPIVDKHSTGGIGDKVSLILAPLLACCGLHVPMISGRGLGPTGGTLDKLESIPGFRTNLSLDEIVRITERVGCVITGATREIAPADRKLYALRDVTATVASIPLITASIMSKKLAEGLDTLVLDVKWGNGAFMKTVESAQALARSLVSTGQRMNVRTTALLTDMNQPLGRMAGNANEVNETWEALCGDGPPDLMEVTFALGTELLVLSGTVTERADGEAQLHTHLASGAAREKFLAMVEAQGGSFRGPLPVAPAQIVTSPRSGFVTQIDTEKLGHAIIELGGGRRIMTDKIDPTVGIEMLVRLGDSVTPSQPLVRLFSRPETLEKVSRMIADAIIIGDEPVPAPQLIVGRID